MGKIHVNELSRGNRGTFEDFLRWSKAEGLKEGTRLAYFYSLKKLDDMLGEKPFEEVTKGEMTDVVAEIKEGELAEGTVKSILARVKKFYKWLLADPDGDEYPDIVKWVKVPRNEGNTLPDDILVPKEIRSMADACDHPQDRATVSTIYESGLRVGEFLSLNVGSVEFDERMGRIILPRNEEGQKTGQRRVPLINSVPYLQEWLNQHPLDGRKSPLWISLSPSNYRERLGYHGLRKKLRRIAREAGVDKDVNPHLFRHSRATEIAKKGIYSEAEMRIMLGWKPGSDQPSRYIHLAGADVDEKFRRDHGLAEKEEEEKEEPLEPKECPRCDYRNPAGARFCNRCGLALSLEAAKELEEGEEEVVGKLAKLKDADVMQMLETITRMHELAKEDSEIREKLEGHLKRL